MPSNSSKAAWCLTRASLKLVWARFFQDIGY
jgi:hypothetical protein